MEKVQYNLISVLLVKHLFMVTVGDFSLARQFQMTPSTAILEQPDAASLERKMQHEPLDNASTHGIWLGTEQNSGRSSPQIQNLTGIKKLHY